MIKTDAQRERTRVQIAGFQLALEQARTQKMAAKRAEAIRQSYETMIQQLEDELSEYDRLKSGQLEIPPVDRLDQIAPFIVRMRIAKGISQTELAKRLGVSKQVISRSEEEEYQGVAIARLQSILDALGIKTRVNLTA
jgi:HTH-type transcriptional regulator / antitoxin HigA